MKPRTLAILGALTVGAAGLAAWTLSRQNAATAAQGDSGPLIPGLAAKVNAVASLSITKGATTFSVALKPDGTWGLSERGGYAAKFESIKAAIVGIAGLTIDEPRTRNPAHYDKIGVEDPTKAGATGMLVTLADQAGATLASVIVGKPKTSTGFNAPPLFYARRAGEDQSWVVRPARGGDRLDVRADPMEWIDRTVIQLPRDRVKTLVVTHADTGERIDILKPKKEDPNFAMLDMPEGRELRYPSACDAAAGALNMLTMDDVKPAAEVSFDAPEPGASAPPVSVAEYRTWDGVVVIVRSAKVGDKTWAKFEARYEPPPAPAEPTPPPPAPGETPTQPAATPAATPTEIEIAAAKLEAEQLQSRLSPWTFVVADWQVRNIAPRREELLKPPPDAPPQVPSTPPDGIQPFDPGFAPAPTPPQPAGGMGPTPPPPGGP
ncbi:MAG: DUF4340 domain-containing protein [Phycisphaerales bacterium]